jgi:hypothetical protein
MESSIWILFHKYGPILLALNECIFYTIMGVLGELSHITHYTILIELWCSMPCKKSNTKPNN